MKKRLALLTLASIMLTSSVPVYASGGTSTTMNATSSFTSELEPTDLSQIVVSIPDNMDLALNNDKTKFVSSGNVSAKGTLKDGYQLSVSTNESATYKCTGKPDVAGTVTFGTQTWSSAQLEASKTTLDSRAVSVEVANSDDLVAGTYTTNILFNIGVSEAHVHTAGSPVKENRTQLTYDNFDYYDNLGIFGMPGNDFDVGDYVYDEVVYCTSCHEEMSRTPKLEHELITTIENYVEPKVVWDGIEDGTYDETVHCANCDYTESTEQKYVYCERVYDHYDNFSYSTTEDRLTGGATYYRYEYTHPEYGGTELLNERIPYEHGHGYYTVTYYEEELDEEWNYIPNNAFNIESFKNEDTSSPDLIPDKGDIYDMKYSSGMIGDFTLPSYLYFENTDYWGTSGWKEFTSLADRAFVGCTGFESIHLPDGIRSIGDEAFKGCENLQSIEIPASVTSIGSNVIDNCYNIGTISGGFIKYKGTKAQFQSISGYENLTVVTDGVDYYDIDIVCTDGTLTYNNGVLQ